jgi:RecA-family ATPase
MNLPTLLAHRLAERPRERDWLIDQLWGDEAVGIVGGEPKSCKSFLALEIAVSVAGGVPCLRRFQPMQTGRVLLFAAEDALHIVRQRLAGIAAAAGRELVDLDIHVVTAPSVRLDVEPDRDALTETIVKLEPTLLVPDPFVRLHRIDENISGEVAPLLAYLRELQRRFHVAVVLVHHARKGGAKMRAGQALRGSSEFHAWGDSNLYLRRHGDQLMLEVMIRANLRPDREPRSPSPTRHARRRDPKSRVVQPPLRRAGGRPAPRHATPRCPPWSAIRRR